MIAQVRASLQKIGGILFVSRAYMGLGMLLLGVLAPRLALAGLLTILLTILVGRILSLPIDARPDGLHYYNAFLIGLGVGACGLPGWSLPLACLFAAGLTILVGELLDQLFYERLGLPVLSLPFVLVSWVLMQVYKPETLSVTLSWQPPAILPECISHFFVDLGALLFMPHWLPGIILFALLLYYSRVLATCAILGYVVDAAVHVGVGGSSLGGVGHASFNGILTALAVGGAFLLPSRRSLGLAIFAVACSTVLQAGLDTSLSTLHLPVLTMPFVLCTWGAILIARRGGWKELSFLSLSTPEESLAFAAVSAARHLDGTPLLGLPYSGAWTVWQAFDGAWTHKGIWRYAIDFVVTDHEGCSHTGAGQTLVEYYCFRKPVMAPCGGRVIKVVNHLLDNEVGGTDPIHPWGNLLILQHPEGWHVEISHFAQYSITVQEGAWINEGDMIGLCGNSGNSPQPHIHIQVQDANEIAGVTRPFAFRDAFANNVYHNRYQPVIDDVMRPLGERNHLSHCFGADRICTYIPDNPQAAPVRLQYVLGPTGLCTFSTKDGKLYGLRTRSALVLIRLEGSDPFLRALYRAMPRLPFGYEQTLAWEDAVPATLGVGSATRHLLRWIGLVAPAVLQQPTHSQMLDPFRFQTRYEKRTDTATVLLDHDGVVSLQSSIGNYSRIFDASDSGIDS